MGRYWDHEGPHQEDYDRLQRELVQAFGETDTLEGECLRAAGKLEYEFYNNGGGNNVSGALLFLQKHFPDFRSEWWDVLAPYVTGEGGEAPEEVYECCEMIVDAVVVHVAAKNGRYSPNPEDMYDLTVKETGMEPEQNDEDGWEDDWREEDDWQEEEDLDSSAISR